MEYVAEKHFESQSQNNRPGARKTALTPPRRRQASGFVFLRPIPAGGYNRPMQRSFSIFLHSDRYDRVYQAVNLLAAASSMGRHCHLFLFYASLASYMDGSWDDVNASGIDARPETAATLTRNLELAGGPSLYDVVRMAKREQGGLQVVACSTSVQRLGLEPADVGEKVDQIAGLTTMLEIAADGQSLYI